MEEWESLEWEQLRVVGKPLLSGAAFGATPLLWVACRAQPCLVHVFCDTKLQEIWRFPADPVFLSIASGARPQGNHEGAPSLLVITREGCIWIVQLSKTSTGASRPLKRQRTQHVGEIQRVKPPKAAVVEALSPVPSQRWKRLDVKNFTPTSRAIEVKNVLVAETLLGTAPGAKVAAFGPNNYVAVGSPVGAPELLCVNRLAVSSNASHHPESAECRTSTSSALRREPACLLVVASVGHRQKHGPGDCEAVLSQDLFESLISSPNAGASDHEILLIQGGMDGKVCTFRMHEGTAVAPPHTVCELHQPVVTIIPAAHLLGKNGSSSQMGATQGRDEEARGANWLVVVGVLGRVAFLSSVRDQQPSMEEPSDGPFLARRTPTPTRVVENASRSLSILQELGRSNEGGMSGPVTSACLVGGGRLCYTVGSAVFVTELFDSFGSILKSGGVGENTSSSPSMLAENSLMKLPCQRIPVSNVAAITGPGLFTYHGTHSLVALTGAGKLLSIKTSKQFASQFPTRNPGVDCGHDSLKTDSGNSVKVSLQSIADAESCRDAIQSHERALTLAMNELALALPRARDIATDKKKLACKTSSIRNNHSTSKEESATANEGLECTLTATPVPSTTLGDDRLSFGGIGFGSLRKPSNFVDRNVYKNFKTRLDIALVNHSRNPLSQYWSCILELQSCLSPASPASQFSFTINNGHGLPVGFQWNHRIHVNLPGGPWGPVMATMYLCHLHDSHKALLQNPRSSSGLGRRSGQILGTASSAGCVVLLRQRIDLFSLLQGPQSTLGHTSWTPALSGNTNLKTKVSSLAVMPGMGEIELLDLADADMLGSFSGGLGFSLSLDAKHNAVNKPIYSAADWQNAFLSNFLQQPSTSTEWRRLRLTSQGGHTVVISVDGRRGQGGEYQSLVNVQTPCLLLGILLREALLRQIMGLDADSALGGKKKNVVLHRNGSMNFMARLNEVQALVQRAREALNVWKKFQSHHAPAVQDLVAPLLGHTYVVTAELIQAYKTLREEPYATLS